MKNDISLVGFDTVLHPKAFLLNTLMTFVVMKTKATGKWAICGTLSWSKELIHPAVKDGYGRLSKGNFDEIQ
jgi:hypothetical protein